MQHLDEGTIHAWIDGELSPEQAGELEAHVRDCASCAALVAEARGLVAASTRILTALDHVPGGILPSVPDAAPARVIRRRWYQRTDVRAAAALLFVAGTSLVVMRSRTVLRGKSAMIATADTASVSSSATATERAGVGTSEGDQRGIADTVTAYPLATVPAAGEASAASESPPEKTSATTVSPKAVPERRFGAAAAVERAAGTAGARNQSLQQKAMADDRASLRASGDESQLSKKTEAMRRAVDVADLPPPPAARVDATAPAVAAAPADVRSRIEATGGSVEGRVTDKNTGEGLANAQVVVEGTTLGATTDKDGKFRVENVPQGAQHLRVRRVGYTSEAVPLTIEAGKVVAAQIGIGASANSLAEVVVTSATTAPATVKLGAAASANVATTLRVVRTDTTGSMKRTVYEVSRGVEVTLTESPAGTTERDNQAFDLARQKPAAPQRSDAAREAPQVMSGRGVAALPAAPAMPSLNTILWTDRGKRYTLSGRITVKELEAIKSRLVQAGR